MDIACKLALAYDIIATMGLAFEILQLIVQIVWCYIESAYRFIIPVPRKKINGEIVLITGMEQ